MNLIATSSTLEKSLRKKLEAIVKDARDVAESGALGALNQLEVGQPKIKSLTCDSEKDLRRRLRIHGRQLGDQRKASGEQELDRLVEEIAYEHWHRMLFARFLAENDLLMYPDPDDPVSVSIDDCNDLAKDEGAKNGWELAARFAARMLPQIFRLDSPVFSLELPPERQQQLERLLSELPGEVFTASDSLGWGYQYWQAKRNEEVNESEEPIGARELPAATQFFTEPYMVSFLLDNSLGAWWAARRLTSEDLCSATSERELREKAALPSVPLEYLRFVREPARLVAGAPGTEPVGKGPWTPAAGTFESWPDSLADLKMLDPCCGSGHFLVAALLMLTPMRMELEGLSAREAVDRVIGENLHGLEIDQRCVELAAFALALAAWRFPEAGGYRPLPDLNVACCGLSVSVNKEEWKELAKGDNQLKIALDWMYDEFKDAPLLGSLLNPTNSMAAKVVPWDELMRALDDLFSRKQTDSYTEAAVVAHGLARAAKMLAMRFTLVSTNVPYLGRGKQHERIATYCENFADAKADLSTVFCRRALQWVGDDGTLVFVGPQNWLFLKTYEAMRKRLLRDHNWNFVVQLGKNAFHDMNWWAATTSLVGISGEQAESSSSLLGFDVGGATDPDQKARVLRGEDALIEHHDKKQRRRAFEGSRIVGPLRLEQSRQFRNPNYCLVITEDAASNVPLLEKLAYCYQGTSTGDNLRFVLGFWEVTSSDDRWQKLEAVPKQTCHYAGKENVVDWKNVVAFESSAVRGETTYKKQGIIIGQISNLPASLFTGQRFANSTPVIITNTPNELAPVWAFVSSPHFGSELRKVNQKLSVDNGYVGKIPFDLAHWQQVAAEKYPYGLPQPYSDDPTQWIFHGHPASSDNALQVAVARLLGYRWPTESDEEMELATDARAWVECSNDLNGLADSDGIVCIPAVGTEQPAEDQLLNLLHKAYKDGLAVEKQFQEKLEASDTSDSLTVALLQRNWEPSLPASFNDWLTSLLDESGHKNKTLQTWLRDKFFTQHCKLFHHRPFIWHIWDGLKDGFSVLINYHKLDNKLLKTLIYTYLNDWIKRQNQNQAAGVDGSEEKLAAAQWLKERLELLLAGESPHDIFVRWKPLEDQPIGWNPDLNDGVRLNIRPWMTVGDVKKKGAGLLRDKPNVHWKKDRGKDVENAPWYQLGPECGGKKGDRLNEHSLTLAEKQRARRDKGSQDMDKQTKRGESERDS